jgi:hypothetical protein
MSWIFRIIIYFKIIHKYLEHRCLPHTRQLLLQISDSINSLESQLQVLFWQGLHFVLSSHVPKLMWVCAHVCYVYAHTLYPQNIQYTHSLKHTHTHRVLVSLLLTLLPLPPLEAWSVFPQVSALQQVFQIDFYIALFITLQSPSYQCETVPVQNRKTHFPGQVPVTHVSDGSRTAQELLSLSRASSHASVRVCVSTWVRVCVSVWSRAPRICVCVCACVSTCACPLFSDNYLPGFPEGSSNLSIHGQVSDPTKSHQSRICMASIKMNIKI